MRNHLDIMDAGKEQTIEAELYRQEKAREAAQAMKAATKREWLKAAVEKAKAVDVDCAWCLACKRGVVDSTAIPKPSAEMCSGHKALSAEWSLRLARLPFEADTKPLREEIVLRGLEVARRHQLNLILQEVA